MTKLLLPDSFGVWKQLGARRFQVVQPQQSRKARIASDAIEEGIDRERICPIAAGLYSPAEPRKGLICVAQPNIALAHFIEVASVAGLFGD
jgi:hypothetical protein